MDVLRKLLVALRSANSWFYCRVLSNMTQAIEEILNTVQSYIANKLYDRQIDFLRKY